MQTPGTQTAAREAAGSALHGAHVGSRLFLGLTTLHLSDVLAGMKGRENSTRINQPLGTTCRQGEILQAPTNQCPANPRTLTLPFAQLAGGAVYSYQFQGLSVGALQEPRVSVGKAASWAPPLP